MLNGKTRESIEIMRECNLLVSKTLAEIAKIVEPGVTTLELDSVAEEFILDHGAIPGFKGYNGFPYIVHLCQFTGCAWHYPHPMF
jgi:methionyl aminopeptidase